MFLAIGDRAATAATATIALSASTVDGVNTGKAPLGYPVTMSAQVTGASASSVVWQLSGAGAISKAGVYTPPASVPANAAVTVTGSIPAAGVSATYKMTITNPPPVISATSPGQLIPGAANTVLLSGGHFLPGTVLVSGKQTLPTTYVSTSAISVNIPAPSSGAGPVQIIASNPGNGASGSASVLLPVTTESVTFAFHGSQAADGTLALGGWLHFLTTVTAPGNQSLVWSMSGPGTLTSGIYYAPTAGNVGARVTVTAALSQNTAIKASYSFVVTNPPPTISGGNPAQLVPGNVNSITLSGSQFLPGTQLFYNGKALPVTYVNGSTLTTNLTLPGTGVTSVAITASNPAAVGGSSWTFPVAAESVVFSIRGSQPANGSLGLGGWLHFTPTVTAPGNQTLNWSISGPGSLSGGIYNAPTSGSLGAQVSVTATLAQNPAISASYSFTLVNPTPAITAIKPVYVKTNTSPVVTLSGSGFTPSTTVTANGTTVPVTYLSPCCATIPLSIPDTAIGAISLVASNPTPGGGASTAFSLPIAPKTIRIDAYDDRGTNPTTIALGDTVQLLNVITSGTGGNPSVVWTVQGGGTVSPNNVYQAPQDGTANALVTIQANLVTNPAVTATYTMAFTNPPPSIESTEPTTLAANTANQVVIHGIGFIPGTQVLANGIAVPVTYNSPTQVTATVSTAAGQTGPVALAPQNPAPGGGTGSLFSLWILGPSQIKATVGTQAGNTIAQDFLGFSHDWSGLGWFFGQPQYGVNTSYLQLIQNLKQGANYPLHMRIGGSGTDNASEMSVANAVALTALAQATSVKYALGVNFAGDSIPLSLTQAKFYLARVPNDSISAIELGNESEFYGGYGYRPKGYYIGDWMNDYYRWTHEMAPYLPDGIRFFGPSWGSPSTMIKNAALFETDEDPALTPIISVHIYGGYIGGTYKLPGDYLLSQTAAAQGPTEMITPVALAHQHGQKFRIGEMNSIDVGGQEGVSNTFQSALWAVDTMFEYAKVGVDGVNIGGTTGSYYNWATYSNLSIDGHSPYIPTVNPLYYGMLFFQKATANNAHLLPVTFSTTANLKIWATQDPQGVIHVAVINKDKWFSGTVQIALPGHGSGSLIRMTAPNYQAVNGVSIGGQTFDNTLDGTPLGDPVSTTVTPVNGAYPVTLQPYSAALLTISN